MKKIKRVRGGDEEARADKARAARVRKAQEERRIFLARLLNDRTRQACISPLSYAENAWEHVPTPAWASLSYLTASMYANSTAARGAPARDIAWACVRMGDMLHAAHAAAHTEYRPVQPSWRYQTADKQGITSSLLKRTQLLLETLDLYNGRGTHGYSCTVISVKPSAKARPVRLQYTVGLAQSKVWSSLL